MAWAFATLSVPHTPLLTAISAAAMKKNTTFGSQALANSAWAFSRIAFMDGTLMEAISAAALRLLESGGFPGRYVAATLWALSRPHLGTVGLDRSLVLLGRAQRRRVAVGDIGYGPLLMECEQRNLVAEEVDLLHDLGCSGTSEDWDTRRTVVTTSTAMQLAAAGAAEAALARLQSAIDARGGLDQVAQRVWRACGGHAVETVQLPVAGGHEKELRLLEHVVGAAQVNSAEAVCAGIEHFASEVLALEDQWLKVAGGAKAEVLADAVSAAPAGEQILEVGTYCGYSALHLASTRPGVRIVTLEVDPLNVAIARNLIAFAGYSHLIDVWTGHSEDLLPRVSARYGGRLKFCAVFMDQRGSRYTADLEAMLSLGLLKPGAVVIADNVLKPGAPLYLWRVLRCSDFETRIARIKEFAMPVEDWMTVSEYRPNDAAALAPDPPWELRRLELEADRMRMQASRPGAGGASYDDWAAAAARMRRALAEVGLVEDDVAP
eukprot:gnl/TRDRNA2_/TRDRNA2_174188_c3_seq1.p1 gnl/TRDRNA2_/TRDRNA2_174188_c3~~gnl/TRDRNA2_/TRDRNA2_174188_c3_seq1.p1  ORF type:complete len:492 (+),score=81.51 gnl/TRDRNA2_/TRDRNA2_174188_c3_seq1:267-1742(+)